MITTYRNIRESFGGLCLAMLGYQLRELLGLGMVSDEFILRLSSQHVFAFSKRLDAD